MLDINLKLSNKMQNKQSHINEDWTGKSEIDMLSLRNG